MADEQEVVIQEVEQVADSKDEAPIQNQESNQSDSPEYTDAELKAMEHGWKPKEEFSGVEGKWVDADEFNRRGELFDKIDVLSKDLKESKKALKMLQDHHQKVRETEYQRALTNLKAEKKSAFENGDADKIIDIDDRIAEVKAAQIVERQAIQQQVNTPDPRFVQWVERNSWYAQDVELRSFADSTGTAHAQAYPSKSPDEVLDYVAKRVKTAFPEKFTNPNRSKPSAVEGNAPRKEQGRKSEYTLTKDEAAAMNTFVRQGIMTKEEYIDQLKNIKGEA